MGSVVDAHAMAVSAGVWRGFVGCGVRASCGVVAWAMARRGGDGRDALWTGMVDVAAAGTSILGIDAMGVTSVGSGSFTCATGYLTSVQGLTIGIAMGLGHFMNPNRLMRYDGKSKILFCGHISPMFSSRAKTEVVLGPAGFKIREASS